MSADTFVFWQAVETVEGEQFQGPIFITTTLDIATIVKNIFAV